MNPRDEDRVRELLEDAVSGVEPRHGLDSIQSRTKVHTMSNRPWLLGAGAAVVATAATIAAFAVLGSDTGPTASDAPPAASPSTTETTAVEPDETETSGPEPAETGLYPVYYVGETGQGPRLYREFHASPAPEGDAAVAEAVRDAVSVSPNDPDYATLWPAGSDVQHVEMSGDTIVVDLEGAGLLHDRPAAMTEQEAQMSVEQLIYTVQAGYQDRAPVRFLLDGQITDTLLGVPTSEPLAQGDENSTLAQVWIIDPAEGAELKSGFEVSGIGAFFEANATWELRQGDTVVESGFTMAEECCTMAPYSFTVEAPPGDYLLVVKDEDMSGGEGFPPFEDSKNVTITE